MNFEEVKKDTESRSKYVKIPNGQSVKIRFLGDDFKRTEYDNGKEITIKYELPCIVNDRDQKIYSGSYTFYSKCFAKAKNRNKSITELDFIVSRTGEGLQTEYDVDVIG
jgi:hypothetical protein